MFCDNEPSFPDDKLIFGRYLGPAIDTGSALTAKIGAALENIQGKKRF
jgi:hypothetical protein